MYRFNLTANKRILALDIVRGYAMLLMLVSHTSWRLPDFDYRVTFGWDNLIVPDLSAPQSAIGFILQAATPIFFLLTGFSLALFIESRRERGWDEGRITTFLLTRGLVLVALEFGFVNLDLAPGTYGHRISVLTAIGLSLAWLAFLRYLRLRWLLLLMLALLAGTQVIFYTQGRPSEPSLLYAILLAPHDTFPWSVEFPVLPWLPVILLGYLSSRAILEGRFKLEPHSLKMGLFFLGLWLVVIAVNDFGNLYTGRRLIFTKHPPDLAYIFFYVGLTFLLVWVHVRLPDVNQRVLFRGIALLGQGALVFYVLHVKILDILSFPITALELPPMELSFLMALLALPLLFVICWQYRALRRRHPDSVLQYL